jgi:hypothetical protein
MFFPSTSTDFCFSVYCLSGVGINIFVAMIFL